MKGLAEKANVLIAGATGFIGSSLARRLDTRGVRVNCLARPASDTSRLEGLRNVEIVRLISGDADEIATAMVRSSPQFIFNLASYGVRQIERDPETMIEANLQFLDRLLRAAAEQGVQRFVQAGSCSEYAPAGDQPVSETHPLHPSSVYGAMKTAAELYGEARAQQLRIEMVTLRLFNTFGPGEAPERLLPNVISHLAAGRAIDLTGGEQVRDFLYVDDVADAFIAMTGCAAIPACAALNVCSGQPRMVREIAETVADVMAKPRHLLRFGALPYRSDEPMYLVGDPSRFTQATGWRPRVTLQEGIRKMLAQAAAA